MHSFNKIQKVVYSLQRSHSDAFTVTNKKIVKHYIDCRNYIDFTNIINSFFVYISTLLANQSVDEHCDNGYYDHGDGPFGADVMSITV